MPSKEGAFPVVYLTGDSADAWGSQGVPNSFFERCLRRLSLSLAFPNFSIPANLRNLGIGVQWHLRDQILLGVKASGAQSLGKVGESSVRESLWTQVERQLSSGVLFREFLGAYHVPMADRRLRLRD